MNIDTFLHFQIHNLLFTCFIVVSNAEESRLLNSNYPKLFKTQNEDFEVLHEDELLLIDIEDFPCATSEDCKDVLPMLDLALYMGSKIPRAPYCSRNNKGNIQPNNGSGHCTCGPGYCVSFSMEFGKDTPFYYCGPCSHIGAQCNGTCTHEMAECRQDYCQCKKDGSFYEFNYCQIPYIAYETSLQVCIILCIVIVGLLILTSLFNVCRESPWWHNRRLTSDSISEVTRSEEPPPGYDEVIDALPTYQDALQMEEEDVAAATNENVEEAGEEEEGEGDVQAEKRDDADDESIEKEIDNDAPSTSADETVNSTTNTIQSELHSIEKQASSCQVMQTTNDSHSEHTVFLTSVTSGSAGQMTA